MASAVLWLAALIVVLVAVSVWWLVLRGLRTDSAKKPDDVAAPGEASGLVGPPIVPGRAASAARLARRVAGLAYRRRMIVLPLVMVGALATVYEIAPPVSYSASGSIVLVAKSDIPATTAGTVPAAEASSDAVKARLHAEDLDAVVQLLVRTMNSPPVVRRLQAKGLKGSYVVWSSMTFDRNPTVEFAADAPRAADATGSAILAMNEASSELESLRPPTVHNEPYIPPATRPTAPTRAAKVSSGTFAGIVIFGAAGAIALLYVALLAQGLVGIWRRRQDGGLTSLPALHV